MTNNAINSNIPIEVTKGGTQSSSFVAFAPIVGGITSTGALQSVASAGNAGEFLVSQGPSALPIWQAGGGGGGFSNINIQTFSASGTYTPSANLVQAVVVLTGGGGGGGNVVSPGGPSGNAAGGGGGGGAGETRIGSFSAATIGASQIITIGTGGGSAANGSSSSFGTLMIAGYGNAGGNWNGTNGLGGGSTAGSGGSFAINNGIGFRDFLGIYTYCGGYGGSSYFSYGGNGGDINITIFGNNSSNGGNGSIGAGGGGGAATNQASAVGGSGGNGYCVVYEYIG